MVGRGRRYGAGAAGGIALTAAAIAGIHAFQVAKAPQMTPSITGPAPQLCSSQASVTTCAAPAERPPAGEASTGYRNGDFAAEGSYLTPGGSESIGVRLTVADGRVVRSAVSVEATSPTARQFQRQFASRYASRVVTRDLGSLKVSRVAGASLTSLGFDDAVAKIQEAARVTI